MHNANAFIPFSFGPSNCVGKQLAMQEMRIVICHLLQKLDMRLPEDWDSKEYERQYQEVFGAVVGELPILVRARA